MISAKPEDRLTVLRKRVAKIPKEPGVYRWLGADGSVLYVGKAKSLRDRMKSYVASGPTHTPWTAIMVKQITDFDVTVVPSELEAFILESNLIKELRPKYNIMLKDDKGYVYVRVSKEKYPRVEVVRHIDDDDAKYFGPFMGARDTHQTLEMLDGILKYRACRKSLDALNEGKTLDLSTPCLDFQIGKCCGLCIGVVSEAEYGERIDEIVRFFRGNFTSMKRKAQEQMNQAASTKKFERAARIRDVLKFIEDMEQKQVVYDTSGENADVFGIALRKGKIQAVLFRQREGKLIEQIALPLKGEAESAAEALAQFLPQYYGETADIPDVIVLPEVIEESELLEAWLRMRKGKVVKIRVPERGKKSKLLEMAQRNAEQKVEQQFAAWEAEQQKVEGALTELASLIGLPAAPRRIEGYDISHLGGTATVGSMVVFLNGKPKREHYRSFNMRTVQEGAVDDYKSLAETIRRRLKYLTDDLKTATARAEKEGITLGWARKGEQESIETICKGEPDLAGDVVTYEDFLVARAGEAIVGFCRLVQYANTVTVLRCVWVRSDWRGRRLGQLLVRTILKSHKKGKVYVHFPDSSLEDYYSELGFQPVGVPPPSLQKKLAEWSEQNPGKPLPIVFVWIASKSKEDESFADRPNLILIDGGKGQLAAAKAVIDEFGLPIPVASLAKREEEIFLPDASDPLVVPQDSPARFFLQRIRDESHRFANAKRETRLEISMFQSKLDQVPGIGPKTRSLLLKRFGSADAVIAASDADLQKELTQPQLQALRTQFPRP